MSTPLHALILAGGHSRRMGQDKALMDYHGMPQYLWLAQLLGELNIPVHLSCRSGQEAGFSQKAFPHLQGIISDRFGEIGPMGGILSAMQALPETALLVVACDMPLLDQDAFQFLLENRNDFTNLTSYRNPEDGQPEPLMAIWEPTIYPYLEKAISLQAYSLRKLIKQLIIKSINPIDPKVLLNINRPDEAEELRKRLVDGA